MSKYYQLELTGKKADLYIFGNISSYDWPEKDKSSYKIVKELKELDADEIVVHINSMGGSVPEALAIYNVLRDHPAKIITQCDGFACSAASVIFMAGTERQMHDTSLLMIHNAWVCGHGNAAELRKQADDLDKITQMSINAYKREATISEEEIAKMMDEETWIDAYSAKEYGFATTICEEVEEGINQSAMGNIKEHLMQKKDTAINYDQIADKVVEKIEKRKEESKPKQNGWDAFFNGGK